MLNVRTLPLEGKRAVPPLYPHELTGYKLSRLLDEIATPGTLVSGVASDQHNRLRNAGFESRYGGTLVPPEVCMPILRDLMTGTGTGTSKGGNLLADAVGPVQPELGTIPQVIRAGCQVLGGLTQNVSLPTFASSASATWVAENSGASTDAVFSRVRLQAYDLVATLTYSRRLGLQAAPQAPVEQVARDHLGRQFARALDEAALGSGATNKPVGIAGTSGVASVAIATSGGALTRAKVWTAAEDVLGSGALTAGSRLAWMVNTKTARHAANISDGSGFLYVPNPQDATVGTLAGLPAYLADSLPHTLSKGAASGTLSRAIVGDFRALCIGLFSPLEFIVDHYTAAIASSVKVTAIWSVGVCVLEPSAFAVISDIATG